MPASGSPSKSFVRLRCFREDPTINPTNGDNPRLDSTISLCTIQIMTKAESIIPVERIASRIYLMRGEKVMLDGDLAELYGVETGALVRAVKRNSNRFPEEFSFQLNNLEFEDLRCQTGISSQWGGRRYPPYAFTEQGVAMLSSVLRSARAAEVNIAIIRTFVK